MAALFWHSEVRNLSVSAPVVGEVKFIIENQLRDHGFQDVRLNDLEVAGGKNGVWLSIGHFRITDSRFWEIVMASGDDFDVTRNTVGEVVDMLHAIHFL